MKTWLILLCFSIQCFAQGLFAFYLGFSGSKSGENIGGFYFAIRSNGTAMNRPVLVQGGRDYFSTYYRWGDYSAMSLDPNDSQTFWTFQEFADTDGSEFYCQPVGELDRVDKTKSLIQKGNHENVSCLFDAHQSIPRAGNCGFF